MFGSHWELIVVGLIVVLLFGTKRLPELGSGLGRAISNFKKGYREGEAIDVTPKPDASGSEERSTSQNTDSSGQ